MNYIIFALLAAFFFGLAPIFGKLGLEGVNPVLALSIRSFIITGVMLVWLLLNTDISPVTSVSTKTWLLIGLEGICAALIGQLLYYYALKSGDPSIVVPLIATFPLFTFILATTFLGDKITLTKVGGLAFILMGIFLIRT
jgi:transporter family protein